jgi:hypothetical protein
MTATSPVPLSFGGTIRTKFKRSNQPFAMQYGAGGTQQQYYKLTPEQANLCIEATGGNASGTTEDAADAQ